MQLPTNRQNGNIKPWLLSTFTVVVLAAGVFGIAVANQRAIADWWLLRGYQAPTAVAQIATQNTMTDQARHVFYVNHPTISERGNFTRYCPSGSREQTIVLGCYQSDQAGIYLLNVTDPRLDGVKQVTAAHEMLHAAYDRLSSSERQDVDRQLMDYYQHGLQDARIKSTIDAYKKTEPKDVVNEMHSIFGTEVAQLPSGLEQYYKRYFSNRAQVAALSARYQQEFTSRKDQVAADDARLQAMKDQIEALDAQLKSQLADINNRQAELVALRNGNNISAYNAGVPGYNQQVSSYNAAVEQVRSLIDDYNQLVNERNAIALEEDQLVKSLSAQNQTITN